MKAPRRNWKILTIAILIALAVLSIMAIVMHMLFKDFKTTEYIMSISVLALAVLTVVTVMTTNGQLDIMRAQLAEMRLARRLDAQPLPILAIDKIMIEPPRFFYNPSEDQHSFHIRLRVDFNVKNHTAFPAVNLTASAAIMLNDGRKPTIVRCAATQVDLLAAGDTFPGEKDRVPEFLFADEKDDDILAHLQKKSSTQLPVLPVHIVYANVLGACFAVDATYRIVPLKTEDEEILKNWHSLVVSFPSEYKDQLRELQDLKKDKKEAQWKKAFDAVDKKLAASAGKEDLALSWERMPNTFQVQTISAEEYKETLGKAESEEGGAPPQA